MTKTQQDRSSQEHVHVDAADRTLAAPVIRLDLAQELAEVRSGEGYGAHGQNAKTLARYPDLRVVLIALAAGKRIEQHQTKGRVSIHNLEGKVTLKLGTEQIELGAGCLLEIAPGLAHDVEALEPSALLLTIAWPVADAPKA